MTWLIGWSVVVLVVGLEMLSGGRAQASVNLPLHHWAYDAIERLTALGVIDRAMVVPKPYSRKQAAKHVARAIERIRADQITADGREVLAEPLLERLIQFLQPELVELGTISARRARREDGRDTRSTQQTRDATDANDAIDAMSAIRIGGRAQLEADAFSVGRGSVRFRENRMGQFYANGEQVQSDLRGWLELGDVLALTVDPKYISNAHALGIGAVENNRNVYLQEFNAKLTLFNIAIQVGRSTNWWGPGYHGSLLLTDHAFPLDMVQIGSDEPFRLPWYLQSLGEWKLNTFYAQLERDRDFPRAKVFGLRISYLPTSWLELGLTRLTQFDGRGRNQSFPKTVFDVYVSASNKEGEREANEQAMLDVRLRVPHVPYLLPFPAGMQVYGELAGEDTWIKRTQFLLTPRGVGFLTGIYVPQLMKDSTMDLRIEYADTRVAADSGIVFSPRIWYNNSVYTSGMRHRGFPLGHHMGTDAKDFFVRTTRYLTDEIQIGANFNLQRRDLLGPSPERKTETAFDLTWWVSPRTQFTLGYTYQRIENPGQITSINPFIETFPAGVTSTNHFLWTNMAVEF